MKTIISEIEKEFDEFFEDNVFAEKAHKGVEINWQNPKSKKLNPEDLSERELNLLLDLADVFIN